MERIENVEAPTAEAETEAALNVVIVEYEDVGAIMTEGDAEILTIEYSPEWGGTLIKEETEMAETREFTLKGDVPSTSIAELENLVPQRKKIRSREEVRES